MTSRKPVDELRTRRALAALDQHAIDHPEAFDPDRLAATPGELQEDLGGPRLGRPPAADPMVAIGVRLPRSTLAALDTAIAARGIGRQDALREAVDRWLRRARRHTKRS